MNTKYMQGFFNPRNPVKYKGKLHEIIYRSSLELKFMCWLDDNKDVLKWSSEEIYIPYKDKATGKYRLYFPDFWYMTIDKEYIIEVKPARKCKPPKKGNIKEVREYATNTSKWEMAHKFAQIRNMKFVILNEHDLKKL